MTSVIQAQDRLKPPRPIVASRNAFVGRTYELVRLEAWLQEPPHLITLAGPAGVGKSRLLLELLPSLTSFDVVFLDAAQLGAGFMDHWARAVRGSSQKPRLLILDHLEPWHDLVFAQSLQNALAQSNLRVLAVSQGPLLPDQRRFELEPLSTVAVQGPSGAAEFFAALSGLNPNDSVVQALCETLGGLPLALEIASAQLSFLSPSELLEHAVALLNLPNPNPNAPHHTTLLRALERNLVGLNELERLALACLNECRGPVQSQTLIAMLEQPAMTVLPLMRNLCESHLVDRKIQADGTSRFGLPAMMRLYNHAPTRATHQATELRQRHAMYFTELALQELQPSVYQTQQQRAIVVLGQHRNDLEHARQYWMTADGGDAFAAQQLFRLSIGYAHAIAIESGNEAFALEILERPEESERLLEDSLQRLQEHPEHPAKAITLCMLAWRRLAGGDAPESIRLMRAARSIFERHNNGFEIARALCGLACAHLRLHETNLALTFLNESRRVQRESVGQDESDLLEVFARCELELGAYSAAWSHLHRATQDLHARGQWNRVMLCLTGFAEILIRTQHLEHAARLCGHIEFLRCRHMLQATNHCKTHLHRIQTALSELEPAHLNELQRQGMTWTHTLEVIAALERHPDLQAIFGRQSNPGSASLSKRQLEVMNLIRTGLTNKRIAQQLRDLGRRWELALWALDYTDSRELEAFARVTAKAFGFVTYTADRLLRRL